MIIFVMVNLVAQLRLSKTTKAQASMAGAWLMGEAKPGGGPDCTGFTKNHQISTLFDASK